MGEAVKALEEAQMTQWVYKTREGTAYHIDLVNGVPSFEVTDGRAYIAEGKLNPINGTILFDEGQKCVLADEGDSVLAGWEPATRLRDYSAKYTVIYGPFKATLETENFPIDSPSASSMCEADVHLETGDQDGAIDKDALHDFFRFIATGLAAEYLGNARAFLNANPDHCQKIANVPVEKLRAVRLRLRTLPAERRAGL